MSFLIRHTRGKKRSLDWFRLGMALSLLAGVLGVVLLLIIVRAYRPERTPNDDRALRDATLTPVPTSPPGAVATPFSGGSVSPNPTLVAPSATPSPWAVFLPVVAVAPRDVAPTVGSSPTPTPPAPISPRPRPIIARATPIPVPGNPNQVIVPDLVGLPEAVAQRVINESGLMTTYVNYQTIDQVADHRFFLSIPPGAVLSQTPAAGATVPRGTRVALAIRRG